VLRACNRVLTPGGRISFLVIALSGESSPEVRAGDVGPEFADADPGYPALMAAADFADIVVIDVTADYAQTLDDWTTAWDTERTELESLLGAADFADRQTRRQRAAQAVRAGDLQRLWVTARRPV